MSGNRLDDVAVQVPIDGQWLDGWIDCWDRRGNRWFAFVRYHLAPAETYLGWFEQDLVRRSADEAPG
jgi:hypothetical protein